MKDILSKRPKPITPYLPGFSLAEIPKIPRKRPLGFKKAQPLCRGANMELFPVEATYRVLRTPNGLPRLQFSPQPKDRGGLPDALYLLKTDTAVIAVSLEGNSVISRSRIFAREEPLVKTQEFNSRLKAETAFGNEVRKTIFELDKTTSVKQVREERRTQPIYLSTDSTDPEGDEEFLRKWNGLIMRIANSFPPAEGSGYTSDDLIQILRLKALYIRRMCGATTGYAALENGLKNVLASLFRSANANRRNPSDGFLHIDSCMGEEGTWHETIGAQESEADDIDNRMGRDSFKKYDGYYPGWTNGAREIVRLIVPPAYVRLAKAS